MTTQSYTFLEMAQAIAQDEAEIAAIQRQLRYFGSLNLIKALPDARDGRGTGQYSNREMLIARLLLAANDHNMTHGDLAWLRSVIDRGRSVASPETGTYEINLDAIVPRIAKGETWLIQLAAARGTEVEDRTTLAHWVRLQADGRRNQFGDHYPDPLAAGTVLGDGRQIEAVTYIHATNLLGPLIGAEV